MLILLSITACKKAGEQPAGVELKAQLINAPGKVWLLAGADASDVWEDQLGKGWVEYTNQAGQFTVSDCMKRNDYIVFRSDGSYTQSAYTCNIYESNFPIVNQPGGTGQWQLSADRTLQLDFITYRLISGTATDLYLANLYGTYHFVAADSRPFLTATQYFAGTGSKAWKLSQVKIGGVAQVLTAAQQASRLVFKNDGTITDASGTSGTWTYDAARHAAVYSSAGNTQQWNVLELTETLLTYQYFDGTTYTIISWAPQN